MKKANLAQKICPVCARPFSWRKKWKKTWDEVRYCSAKCRIKRKPAVSSEGLTNAANSPLRLHSAFSNTTSRFTKE
ncbi:DUF2256 domain-containing protein [Pseudorhodobacter aquimaris]|uniref:DUF2256 domain-containing protein n=1 Tax=Pseudorhodobacter aquimaris TaxID=687412 RepID=UPI00067BC212